MNDFDFKAGDKVVLRPASDYPENVYIQGGGLKFGEIYTIESTGPHADPEPMVQLTETDDTWWMAERFQLSVELPSRGDEVEIILRAKTTAVLRVDDPAYGKPRTVVYLEGGQSITLLDNESDGVQSLTIVKPAKPALDLDALPEGAVVEGFVDPPLGPSLVYRKRRPALCFPWQGMDGGVLSSADLLTRHHELVELVRKDPA